MPLQGDQRALLQLLCERGQSYEDISGLLGVHGDEVREQARAALTEIGGSDPDADVGLTDYLLGQADPIGRADAVRHLQGDPEALELAQRIQDRPARDRSRRQAAEPARAARQAAPARRFRMRPPHRAPDGRLPRRPDAAAAARRRRSLIAGLAALGLLLVFGVLALAGVFSGGDSDSTTSTRGGHVDDGGQQHHDGPAPPVGGSGVAGKAVFGLVSNQQLYVDVDVQGLDPNLDTGKSYLLWLMVGDSAGYPIDRLEADDNGSFSGRLSVPTPIAVAVGNQAQSVRVSATSVSALQSEIKQATKQKVPILPFTGDQLATGDIPLVGGRQGSGGQGQG